MMKTKSTASNEESHNAYDHTHSHTNGSDNIPADRITKRWIHEQINSTKVTCRATEYHTATFVLCLHKAQMLKTNHNHIEGAGIHSLWKCHQTRTNMPKATLLYLA